MKMRITPFAYASLLSAFLGVSAVSSAAAGDVLVHNADTLNKVELTWNRGEGNPEARVELNTDRQFISEGRASILLKSVAPLDAGGQTSYIGFKVPVGPFVLDDQVTLTFDAWSSEPETTPAFYVRCLNAEGKIVAGWSSWRTPLGTKKQKFTLRRESEEKLVWENNEMIVAPDDKVAFLEFIIGSRSEGMPYNLLVDNIHLVSSATSSSKL
jgi:hypothetical protein